MTLHVLDEFLRNGPIVEGYQSLIWTERFSAMGDFELITSSTPEHRALLREGSWLGRTDTYRVMKIETIDDTIKDGQQILKITGRSMEVLLEDRSSLTSLEPVDDDGDPQTPKKFGKNMYGKPRDVPQVLFESVCMDGQFQAADKLPFIRAGTLFPPDNLPIPDKPVQFFIPLGTLYERIKEICDIYDIGFRLYRERTNGYSLYFNVYAGVDRTSAQGLYTPVVFSKGLDNLLNVTELNSSVQYKNTAYVVSDKTVVNATVYSDDTRTSGFDRRVLVLNVNDLPEFTGTDAEIIAQQRDYLTLKGREALLLHRKINIFDGEISKSSRYIYGRDYNLGDMVEMRNDDGATKFMRVSEQIFVENGEGKRSYPTLKDVLYITPGSWVSWDFNQVWEEATETWSDK